MRSNDLAEGVVRVGASNSIKRSNALSCALCGRHATDSRRQLASEMWTAKKSGSPNRQGLTRCLSPQCAICYDRESQNTKFPIHGQIKCLNAQSICAMMAAPSWRERTARLSGGFATLTQRSAFSLFMRNSFATGGSSRHSGTSTHADKNCYCIIRPDTIVLTP